MVLDYVGVASEMETATAGEAKQLYEELKTKLQDCTEFAFRTRPNHKPNAKVTGNGQVSTLSPSLQQRLPSKDDVQPVKKRKRDLQGTGPQYPKNPVGYVSDEMDPFRGPVENLLFVLSCNQNAIRPL